MSVCIGGEINPSTRFGLWLVGPRQARGKREPVFLVIFD